MNTPSLVRFWINLFILISAVPSAWAATSEPPGTRSRLNGLVARPPETTEGYLNQAPNAAPGPAQSAPAAAGTCPGIQICQNSAEAGNKMCLQHVANAKGKAATASTIAQFQSQQTDISGDAYAYNNALEAAKNAATEAASRCQDIKLESCGQGCMENRCTKPEDKLAIRRGKAKCEKDLQAKIDKIKGEATQTARARPGTTRTQAASQANPQSNPQGNSSGQPPTQQNQPQQQSQMPQMPQQQQQQAKNEQPKENTQPGQQQAAIGATPSGPAVAGASNIDCAKEGITRTPAQIKACAAEAANGFQTANNDKGGLKTASHCADLTAQSISAAKGADLEKICTCAPEGNLGPNLADACRASSKFATASVSPAGFAPAGGGSGGGSGSSPGGAASPQSLVDANDANKMLHELQGSREGQSMGNLGAEGGGFSGYGANVPGQDESSLSGLNGGMRAQSVGGNRAPAAAPTAANATDIEKRYGPNVVHIVSDVLQTKCDQGRFMHCEPRR